MPPRHLRQCYLGPSPQRTLCLVPRPPQPPPEALGKCFIDRLPDEVLAEILAYLPPKAVVWEQQSPTYEQCPPIALVCKRWERSYDATLYRTISFVHSQWRRQYPRHITKILKQRVDLRHYVRHISIEMYHMDAVTCREITDTISICQHIRNVSLHLVWSNKVWPIIRAVEMLPRLEVLWLSSYENENGPSLQMILGHFNQPTLREV